MTDRARESSGAEPRQPIRGHELGGQVGFLVPGQALLREGMGLLRLDSGQLLISDLPLLDDVGEFFSSKPSPEAIEYFGANSSLGLSAQLAGL